MGGTINLIGACQKSVPQAYFVYVSSPCVFSGNEGGYTELSLPYPKHVYGLTKVVAETIVSRSTLESTLIVRTNFVPKAKWPFEGAFTDRFGTYLFADDVARGLREITGERVTGLLHLVGDKKLSMYDLAVMTTPKVRPITLKDYTGPPLTRDMSMQTIHPRWRKFKISKPDRQFS